MKHLLAPLLALAAMLSPTAAHAQTARELVERLIPMPRRIELRSDKLTAAPSQRQIRIFIDGPDSWNDEQYSISVRPHRVDIHAKTQQGVVWARRTLAQLADSHGRLPQADITDWPEFPFRGFMWDDGRNFVGTTMVKHYIDMMSAYKINVFHWHLTDHPAWRIESHAYPQLNDPQYQRAGRDTGCFYTYDEIRDVIAYARERGITVVPEIDMPGHSTFFRTAFGCTMESGEGRAILERCIAEFCDEIPADICPYIHIGSDEVRVADPAGFMRWAQDVVRSHGRRTLAWDPGLPADSLTIRQLWRDGSSVAASLPQGVPFVDSSMGYLNYFDPLLFNAKLFFHTPCGSGRAGGTALGGILCMWNDVRAADKPRIEHHNGMAPGMLIYAERFWNGGRTTDEYIGTLLPAPTSEPMQRFERFQRRMQAHKERFIPDEMQFWSPIHASEWQIEMRTDTAVFNMTAYGDAVDLATLAAKAGIDWRSHIRCRMTRTITSDCDTVRRFRVGFDSPARSNRLSDGIAQQGQWVNRGRLTVNGAEIAPPRWNEPGAYCFHFNTWARPEEEFPFTDEQLYWMREPLPIPLHKGENSVELYIERHFPGQRFHAAFIEE